MKQGIYFINSISSLPTWMCNSIFNFRYTFQSRRLFSYSLGKVPGITESRRSSELSRHWTFINVWEKHWEKKSHTWNNVQQWLSVLRCSVRAKNDSFPRLWTRYFGMCVFIIYILVWIGRLLRSGIIFTFHFTIIEEDMRPFKAIVVQEPFEINSHIIFFSPVWLKPQPFIPIYSPRQAARFPSTTYNTLPCPCIICLSLLFNLLKNRPAEIACDDLLMCFSSQQRRLQGWYY